MQHHHEYKISGVSVLFPCKPYPSQFSMMDKIIKGIERRQNCLIESPTGSGKSLALLCSTLAWQFAEKAKQDLADAEEPVKDSVSSPKTETVSENQLDDLSSKKMTTDLLECDSAHDEDDFKSVSRSHKQLPKTKDRKKHVSIEYESDHDMTLSTVNGNENDSVCVQKTDQNDSSLTSCTCDMSKTLKRAKIKIPKIYFGTRTHKQVAQIVRELKKTGYHDVRMSVLGSREHTCIHPQVSRVKNKTEACKELLNDKGCHFKDSTLRLTSQNVIKNQGLSTAWDLEDLVSFCKTKRACAYFLSRGLKDESDLIICPYNYLVDPMVREAMKISLKGHIVILDEAHNIEDSAREAASQSLTQDSILKAIKDIESLMEANVNLADHSKLRSVLTNLDTFINTNKTKLEQKEWDKSYQVWTGFQLLAQLEALGLGPKPFPEYKKALASVMADAEQRKEELLKSSHREQDVMEMKPSTQTILEQVFQVMDYLYRSDLKYVDDYRASLFHSQSYTQATHDGQWLHSKSANGGRANVLVDVYTLNFWCMNPGVAFSDFNQTRSIILTSGTLSPLTSFESELGLEFKIQLEANHVIEDSQVWVGTLGQGPSGSTLQAVFRNLETFAFQDELGNLVLRVCQVVPHGVLCFLPSYNVLDKLMNRWQSTGLKDKLEQLKLVIREPKNSDKLNFDDQLKMFYEAMTPQHDSLVKADTEGAVFFAVCRGKVSEGLDFADNFARAVITVGVPYPNYKDVQVELKRKYNDQHHQTRGLLQGHDWYEVQAFRALNQALGRCIRHRHDWGALIIVDDRFVKSASKYCKGLSKWVRNKTQTFRTFDVAMESLSKFTTGQLALMGCTESLNTFQTSEQYPRTPQDKASREPTCGHNVMSPDNTKPRQVYSIFNISSSLRTTPKIQDYKNKSADSRSIVKNRLGSCHVNGDLTNSPSRLLVPERLFKVQHSSLSNIRSPLTEKMSIPVCSSLQVLLTSSDTHILDDTNNRTSVNIRSQTSADLKDKPAHKLSASSSAVKESSFFSCGTEKSTSFTDLSCSTAHFQDSVMANTHLTAVPVKATDAAQEQSLTEIKQLSTESHAHNNTFLNGDLSSTVDVSQCMTDGTFIQLSSESFSAYPLEVVCKNSSSAGHWQKMTRDTQKGNLVREKNLINDQGISEITQNNPLTSAVTRNIPLTSAVTRNIPLTPTTTQCASLETSKYTPQPLLSPKRELSTLPAADNPETLPAAHDTSSQIESWHKKATNQARSNKKFLFKKTPSKDKSSVNDKSTETNCSPRTNLFSWGFSLTGATNSTSPSAAAENNSQEKDGKLIVRRKVRGTKRKYLSRSVCEERQKEEEDNICQRQSKMVVITCSTCGHILIDNIESSEFKEQRNVPSFLKSAGNIDHTGCLFFPKRTDWGGLQGVSECKTGLTTRYVEHEEICVQFLYCGKCLTDSTLALPAVGAQVKLAAGSGARFSKGLVVFECNQPDGKVMNGCHICQIRTVVYCNHDKDTSCNHRPTRQSRITKSYRSSPEQIIKCVLKNALDFKV